MKIFLNDSTIEFMHLRPENTLFSDLVVEYQSAENLKEAWLVFARHEKFRKLIIVEQGLKSMDSSTSFNTFISLFKMIPESGGLVKN